MKLYLTIFQLDIIFSSIFIFARHCSNVCIFQKLNFFLVLSQGWCVLMAKISDVTNIWSECWMVKIHLANWFECYCCILLQNGSPYILTLIKKLFSLFDCVAIFMHNINSQQPALLKKCILRYAENFFFLIVILLRAEAKGVFSGQWFPMYRFSSLIAEIGIYVSKQLSLK